MKAPLEERTHAELAAGERLLVVPLGATEQHGPHLPLCTDTAIAVALADAIADAIDGAIAAPPLAYGASGEHADFAGTLSIGAAATELVLVELVRSASATFGAVLIVSTHGGNRGAVERAVARLCGEDRSVAAFFPHFPGDSHAGRTETSLMLALRPSLVRLGLFAAGNCAPLERLMPRLVREGVRAVSSNGVLGDPAGASAAEGKLMLAATIERGRAVASRLAAVEAL